MVLFLQQRFPGDIDRARNMTVSRPDFDFAAINVGRSGIDKFHAVFADGIFNIVQTRSDAPVIQNVKTA